MTRPVLIVGSAVGLIAAVLTSAGAEARGRLGIHPDFAGGARPGAGGAGTLRMPADLPRAEGTHTGGVRPGSDAASRGPPRPPPDPGPEPGPDPRPGPGPGPGPRPPLPPPPPPPAWGWGPYWDWYDNDLAWGFATGVVTGAAIASAAAPTVVAVGPVGTVVQILPPGCSATVVGGVTYEHCGNDWLKPQYVGTTIQYVVVAPPG